MPTGVYERTKMVSQITRNKMSISHANYQCSVETKRKISFANKGKTRSEEIKKQMSINRQGMGKGRKHSKESIQKMIESKTGGKHTAEAKIKMSLAKIGKLRKGGRHIKRGYVYIYKPDHPCAINRYVREHRFIMEQHLGRYLSQKEIVHHVNNDRSDNRIENLSLLSNRSQHRSIHANNLSETNRHNISLGQIKRWKIKEISNPSHPE